MDWIGEHLLDYDRPNGEGGKSYRQISQENDARDEASYNKLREKAPCKTAFEDSSNASETTLDLASLAMGVYGVKQLVSSGANYLRMNKSYINANISEAAQNSKILKQAISNIKQNPKGITLPSDIGAFNKYVSDVKGEFDALKNIKNGTKVAGSAKAGGSGSIDDMVKACEGAEAVNRLKVETIDGKRYINGEPVKISQGHQDKHIVGTNNYNNELAKGNHKSILTGDADKLLDEFAATGTRVNEYKERVDFGQCIGKFYNIKTGLYEETTMGMITYGKNGAHIIPSNPNVY